MLKAQLTEIKPCDNIETLTILVYNNIIRIYYIWLTSSLTYTEEINCCFIVLILNQHGAQDLQTLQKIVILRLLFIVLYLLKKNYVSNANSASMAWAFVIYQMNEFTGPER